MSRLALLTTILTSVSVRSFTPSTLRFSAPHYSQLSSSGWIAALNPTRLPSSQTRAFIGNPIEAIMSNQLGIASPEEISATVANPNVMFVDVRNDKEIQDLPFGRPYVHASGTPDKNPVLEEQAEKILPNKDVPVVVFCASGRRANKAKEVLESKGYANVINAGGIANLNQCLPK